MGTGQIIPISAADASQIGQARRRAVSLGASLGLGEVRLGELSIIVTEAANNIASHAVEGKLIVSPWNMGTQAGVDVLAIDKGVGIPDIDQACEDGFSTAGTAGQGLGAISRLAGKFQVYSAQNAGTILFARVYRDLANPADKVADPTFGAISLPITGETACGDAWSSSHAAGRSIYLMADGLGHGPFASEAAREAVRVFQDIPDRAPEFILRETHRALAKTRGAAISIAEILHQDGVFNYAGAGNISGVMLSGGKTRSVVSMNGTVGHSVAKFQQFSYPWDDQTTLILHSDGLATRWNLDLYPGLASRHPAVVAAMLYRDFARGRDDVTVLVTRK